MSVLSWQSTVAKAADCLRLTALRPSATGVALSWGPVMGASPLIASSDRLGACPLSRVPPSAARADQGALAIDRTAAGLAFARCASSARVSSYMRIAHLADLHLGFRQYQRLTSAGNNQREADVARAVRRTIDAVITQRPDLVLIAGDVFHQVRPSNPMILFALGEFTRLRRALAATPIVMIAGNHDLPRAQETGCILALFRSIGVQVVEHEPERLRFAEQSLSVFAIPDRLGQSLPALTTDTDARWNVLLLHGEVAGVLPDRAVMVDRTASEVTVDELAHGSWDYIALGHYHVHRQVAARAWYAGSLEYVSSNAWGEMAEQRQHHVPGKGFVMHDLVSGEHTFVPVPLERRFIDLEPIDAHALAPAAVDELVADRIRQIPDGLDDAVVRLVVREIPRHVARDLDHKAIREYKRRALHFQLDTRKPELVRTRNASGAVGARPSLAMLVREKLETRTLSNDVDRASFVELGLDYLQRVSEPTAVNPEAPADGGALLAERDAP
jgi:DNA repair protein SbcD/Mre11